MIKKKKIVKVTRESALRKRGFRQAIIEAYSYKCAFCGMKIHSPDSLCWEVEAAHIVPHSSQGKDDIWNGLALCRLHHWAFDVGWFTIQDDYYIKISTQINSLPLEFGKIGEYGFMGITSRQSTKILLPLNENIFPHQNSIQWHRENRFCN